MLKHGNSGYASLKQLHRDVWNNRHPNRHPASTKLDHVGLLNPQESSQPNGFFSNSTYLRKMAHSVRCFTYETYGDAVILHIKLLNYQRVPPLYPPLNHHVSWVKPIKPYQSTGPGARRSAARRESDSEDGAARVTCRCVVKQPCFCIL